MTARPQSLAPWLWLLFAAFCLRVLGQMLVAFVGIAWLPPMEAWYSGLVPYPYLLPSQLVIIALYSKICIDFTRAEGFFVRTRPLFGQGVLLFGYLYLLSMIFRYIVRMSFHPEARWFGGTIPIFFHVVLAVFIILFGRYHRARLQDR